MRELVAEMRGKAARVNNDQDRDHCYRTGYFNAMMDAANMLARALSPVPPAPDQRKHEATHGWRNPPSIYEESET